MAPEDIEKVAHRVLGIHLPRALQNLTPELDKTQKFSQLCQDHRTDENSLNQAADGARKVLREAKAVE